MYGEEEKRRIKRENISKRIMQTRSSRDRDRKSPYCAESL